MSCFYITNKRPHKLTVKDIDIPMTTTSGSSQLRNYSSGYITSVQQDSLTLSIQVKNRQAKLDLIQALRQSQKNILNTGNSTDYIVWPQKQLAFHVFPKNIPIQDRLNQTTHTMRLQFGIITGMLETGLANFSGVDGIDYFGQDGWLTHLPGSDRTLKDVFIDPLIDGATFDTWARVGQTALPEDNRPHGMGGDTPPLPPNPWG